MIKKIKLILKNHLFVVTLLSRWHLAFDFYDLE